LALVYMWGRSLVAPIVMHFLQDIIGIVLLPSCQCMEGKTSVQMSAEGEVTF
jgi:membrane protease YdiL (CAAX protease family)